jgi:hypothetical protein
MKLSFFRLHTRTHPLISPKVGVDSRCICMRHAGYPTLQQDPLGVEHTVVSQFNRERTL